MSQRQCDCGYPSLISGISWPLSMASLADVSSRATSM
jgi:hypothetical protein